MWHRRCQHCDHQHLFGIGRVVGAQNLDRGVIELAWSCPTCGGTNALLTGSAAGGESPTPQVVAG